MISKTYRSPFLIILAIIFFPHLVSGEERLTLEASIEIALRNSFVINIAKEGSKSATAQKREAITGFLPKFSTSYSYQRLNEAPFMKFVGIPPPLDTIIPNGTELIAGTQNNYNWTIEAKQPLFAGGGILANYQANSIGEDAALLEEKA